MGGTCCICRYRDSAHTFQADGKACAKIVWWEDLKRAQYVGGTEHEERMTAEEDLWALAKSLGDEHTVEYADVVLSGHAPEIYTMLLTSVTPINLVLMSVWIFS